MNSMNPTNVAVPAAMAPSCLIDGVLSADGLTLFSIPQKERSLATPAALDIALSVASGRPYHGRQTQQGLVLYIAGNWDREFEKSVAAWMLVHGQKQVDDFYVVRGALQLHDPQAQYQIVAAVEQNRQTPDQPALIVIDTLAQCSLGLDEDSADDMMLLTTCAREMGQAAGANILLVHVTDAYSAQGAADALNLASNITSTSTKSRA